MNACTRCKGSGVDPERDRVGELRAWCLSQGHWVGPDDRIHEDAAAEILGVTVGHLRNTRYQSQPIKFYRTGAGRGRVSYSLRDVAEHIERDCM